MSLDSLSQVLEQISRKPTWRRHKRLAIILQCWQELVGKDVAQQTRPTGIFQEVLQVATSSAVWCQELSLQRSPILSKINQVLLRTHPQELLKDIHFSTARWQQDTATPINQINQTNQINKSRPAPVAVEPPADALTAVQRLRHTLEQHTTCKCPVCQSRTTPTDRERWGMCRFCARQRFMTHHS